MSLEAITREDVQGRSLVQGLLPENPREALARAREIRHPWYRCQALAAVAEAVQSRPASLKILTESLAAAFEQSEPNRIVSVASWPLKHLVGVDSDQAARETDRLLKVAATEPHGLRRLDALNQILWAVAPNESLRGSVVEVYLATAAVCVGWRTERTVAAMAEYIATFDLALGKRLIASRALNRFSNRALEALRRHEPRNDA